MVALGLANLVGLAAVAFLYTEALVSLWCVWAAVASTLIAWRMLRREEPRTGLPAEPRGAGP